MFSGRWLRCFRSASRKYKNTYFSQNLYRRRRNWPAHDQQVTGMCPAPMWHSPCAHGHWALPGSVTRPAPCSHLLSLSLEAVIPSPLATPVPLQLQGLEAGLHPCPMPAHGMTARGMLLAAGSKSWHEMAIHKKSLLDVNFTFSVFNVFYLTTLVQIFDRFLFYYLDCTVSPLWLLDQLHVKEAWKRTLKQT